MLILQQTVSKEWCKTSRRGQRRLPGPTARVVTIEGHEELSEETMSEDVRNAGGTGTCPGSKMGLVQINRRPAPDYWKSLEELRDGTVSDGEFRGGLRPQGTRRDFLALMGFTLAAASLSSCRSPVQYAIPLVAGSDQ